MSTRDMLYNDMRFHDWTHAVIGTITHAVFSKLYFDPQSSQDIKREIATITDWQVVDCNIVNLVNGDVIVTVILTS